MTKLNTFKNSKNKYVNSIIDHTEWLSLIKNPGNDYINIINQIRTLDKKNESEKIIIDKLKSQLPTICWSANFKSKRVGSNIKEFTNLIYIDIDFKNDITFIDKNKIYAYWKSVTNTGYSLLVKVNDINILNYKETYKYIIEDLGLLKYYDKSCTDYTRQNILSYDENIIINDNSYIYNSIEVKTPPSLSNKEEEDIYDSRGGEKEIIFTNLNDIIKTLDFEEKNYYVNWDGIDIIECRLIPKIAKMGKRNSFLLSYCNNLVCLNPNIGFNVLVSIMCKADIIMCTEPVGIDRIKRIVQSILKYKNNNTLKPFYTKRKIIFRNDLVLYSKNDKLEICRDLMNEKRKDDSLTKIENIISNWDYNTLGKISQSKIIKNNNISKKTIEKYYSIFKDTIEMLNEEYKMSVNTTPQEELNGKNDIVINEDKKESEIELNQVKINKDELTHIQRIDEWYTNQEKNVNTIIKIKQGFEKYNITKDDINECKNKKDFYWILTEQYNRIINK